MRREASSIVAPLMSTAPTSSRFIAYLLLTSSMALVGTYVALSKPLVAVIPVFALAFLRFAIASSQCCRGRSAAKPSCR